MKKFVRKGTIKEIVIVGGAILIISLGLQVVLGTPNPFYVVVSDSMVPELNKYDVLVIQGNLAFAEVQKGDVIVFNRPAGDDKVIVHRVQEIISEDPLSIRTKGDANVVSIPGTDFPITVDEYLGTVFFVIPQVGVVTQILQPPINYIIISMIIGIMGLKWYKGRK